MRICAIYLLTRAVDGCSDSGWAVRQCLSNSVCVPVSRAVSFCRHVTILAYFPGQFSFYFMVLCQNVHVLVHSFLLIKVKCMVGSALANVCTASRELCFTVLEITLCFICNRNLHIEYESCTMTNTLVDIIDVLDLIYVLLLCPVPNRRGH